MNIYPLWRKTIWVHCQMPKISHGEQLIYKQYLTQRKCCCPPLFRLKWLRQKHQKYIQGISPALLSEKRRPSLLWWHNRLINKHAHTSVRCAEGTWESVDHGQHWCIRQVLFLWHSTCTFLSESVPESNPWPWYAYNNGVYSLFHKCIPCKNVFVVSGF